MPRGGLDDITFSGGRRKLVLFIDREMSLALDELMLNVDRSAEAIAVALLRKALIPES